MSQAPTHVLIVLLCGLPASGKTSLCRWLAAVNQTGLNSLCHLLSLDGPNSKLIVHHLEFDDALRTVLASASPSDPVVESKVVPDCAAAAGPTWLVPSTDVPVLEIDSFSAERWHASRRLAFERLQTTLFECNSHKAVVHRALDAAPASLFHLILVDDNMPYRSMRHAIYRIAQERTLTWFTTIKTVLVLTVFSCL